jgi:hypothetical protein
VGGTKPCDISTASGIVSPEVTEGTEEGLLPGVNSHVQVQLLLGDELFVAKRTQEIQRAVVTLLTSYQLLLIPENNHF